MSPTGRPSKSPSFDFKEVPRQLQVFQQVDNNRQQLLEHLLQRVAELEGSLQTANSDLEDQTSIRRHWKTRAEDAEGLLAQNQFVLALIDGNRYTFADSYFKDTETGGTDAATDLVGQIRSYIQERSLHEDPSGVSLMVHIFANKTAVSEALIDSGTISEPGQFDNFIAQFMRAHPFLYFVDCGSFAGAVDSKIKESYEFHFDNAHCKHLLLALRHESGYVTELDTYGEDESTLARTSLMRSSHAVVGKFASAFRVASTPALRTIPLISLEHANGMMAEKNEESVVRTRFPGRNHDLHGLFEIQDQESPTTEHSGIKNSDPATRERDSSTTSHTATVPNDNEPTEPTPPITSLPLTQEVQKPISVLSPTAPYSGAVHPYMNQWESAPSSDIYTPPPDLRPWGREDDPSFDDASNSKSSGEHTSSMHPNQPASLEPTTKGSDTSETPSVSRGDHSHGGKGAANCSTCRKTKQNTRRTANDSPPFFPNSGREVSNGLLVSRFSSPPGEKVTLQPPSNGAVAINRDGQRIDLPLPRPSADDHARFAARTRVKKICNDHHLRGNCSNAQDCKYDHDPIDGGIRLALQHSARKIPCKIGTTCRRQDCPNGHHCPYRLEPVGCKNRQCAFIPKGMHKVDDHTVNRFVQGD